MKDGKINLPIRGMTKVPFGLAIAGGADFVAFTMAMAQYPGMLDLFLKETGYDLRSVIKAAGLNRMIDESTGYQAATIAAFADWICTHYWGEEEPENPT
jgi:hypothetical protein